MARCELLSTCDTPHARPRRHAVTAGRPFQQLYVSQTSKPRTKEGEKDDRSASCPVCSLRRACAVRWHVPTSPAEDDEIQVELTNETSVVSVCALSNLLSGVSVSSGSLYRGVSNLPSIANYTVNQTSDGLRRQWLRSSTRGAPSAGLRLGGADADEVQGQGRRADADKAHAAATRQRTALPPSRASCPPRGERARARKGRKDTRPMPP
ncbi:hypothetical protein ERJ75_000106000 [Trypanosoma vivax]|nr:hypothetical protein ERJ75_000106000 [Trypanosoma vivax]